MYDKTLYSSRFRSYFKFCTELGALDFGDEKGNTPLHNLILEASDRSDYLKATMIIRYLGHKKLIDPKNNILKIRNLDGLNVEDISRRTSDWTTEFADLLSFEADGSKKSKRADPQFNQTMSEELYQQVSSRKL